MKVKEVMTRDVVTLNEYMSLREASEAFAKEDISGAPVVDKDGKLIGMVTESDILRAVGEAADKVRMVYPSVHNMGVFFEISRGEVEILKAFEEQANTVILDVMTQNVITCTPETTVNEVARILITKSINRLPVVDGDGKVVGIITRGDIVHAFSLNNNDEVE